MATFRTRKTKKGVLKHIAEIRLKKRGKIIHQESKTFSSKSFAKKWAGLREAELKINGMPKSHHKMTLAELKDSYKNDLGDLVRMGRSKSADMERIAEYDIACIDTEDLTSAHYINHVQWRLGQGALPQTVNNDIVWINILLKYGIAAKNIKANLDQIESAKAFLKSTGMIARSKHRDRLPTPEEHQKLLEYFSSKKNHSRIPMLDIVLFAMYSARRQSEVTRIQWRDNSESKTGIVRDLKHPRLKDGNHQTFNYTEQAWAIVKKQQPNDCRIFPCNPRTISANFTRACKILEIKDLRFHDYRHLATSFLFTQGYNIQEVSSYTLHESWDMLKRYTHITQQDKRGINKIHLASLKYI